MPTYEYECDQCHTRFEVLQNLREDPLSTCPDCGGPVRRLLGTGAAVIVKGSRSTGGGSPRCGRDTPCCGLDGPCGL